MRVRVRVRVRGERSFGDREVGQSLYHCVLEKTFSQQGPATFCNHSLQYTYYSCGYLNATGSGIHGTLSKG